MHDEKSKPSPTRDHPKQSCATPAEKRSSQPKHHGWPRLQERPFGSETGSDFRIWGDK